MTTERKGVETGGIGPSAGSGMVSRPLPPATPKAMGDGTTTTLDTETWKIGEQGATYDGVEFYVVTRCVPETISSGVVRNHYIGFRLTVSGDGRLVKIGAEAELFTEEQSGSGSLGGGLW
jgi:hypothetical protein